LLDIDIIEITDPRPSCGFRDRAGPLESVWKAHSASARAP
jgi:hypothetical protein